MITQKKKSPKKQQFLRLISKRQLEKIQEISIFRPKIGSLAGLKVFKNMKLNSRWYYVLSHYFIKANRTGIRISPAVTFHKKSEIIEGQTS